MFYFVRTKVKPKYLYTSLHIIRLVLHTFQTNTILIEEVIIVAVTGVEGGAANVIITTAADVLVVRSRLGFLAIHVAWRARRHGSYSISESPSSR